MCLYHCVPWFKVHCKSINKQFCVHTFVRPTHLFPHSDTNCKSSLFVMCFFQQHVVSFSSMCTYTTVLPPSEHNDYLGYDYKQPTHWYLLQIFFISRSWKYLFHFLFDSLSQVSNSFIPSMIRKKNNDSISHNSNIISHSYSNEYNNVAYIYNVYKVSITCALFMFMPIQIKQSL